MPGLDGLSAAAQLRTALPSCRTIVVTTFGRPGYLRRAMEAGASGFLLKDAPAAQLAEAIRRVAARGPRRRPGARARRPGRGHEPAVAPRARGPRRVDRDGHDRRARQRLSLSEGTVRNHLSAAIQKVGARNRAEAARIAEEKGWLAPDVEP